MLDQDRISDALSKRLRNGDIPSIAVIDPDPYLESIERQGCGHPGYLSTASQDRCLVCSPLWGTK